MIKNSDLPNSIGAWSRRKEGSNIYFYSDSYAATFHEDTQMKNVISFGLREIRL